MALKADDKPKSRLTDIVTNEVSLVDRAANRRKFLITKRDAGMATKLVADGRGGFTEVAKEEGDAPDTDKGEPTAKDAGEGKPAEAEGKPAEGKPADSEGNADLEKAVKMLGAMAERVLDVAKSIRDGKGEIPQSFDEELASMAGEVMKARRLTPSRKDRFAKAIADLKQVLAELSAAGDDGEDKGKTQKSESNDQIASLEAKISELTSTVQKQNDKISKLEDQPAGSNVLPAGELDGKIGKGDEADVAWPMDMNAEKKLSKSENEKRGTSFYD